MTDHADVIREALMDEWTTWERENRTPENNQALAALSRVETEATAANDRMDEIWAEKQAAEARVTELEAALRRGCDETDYCYVCDCHPSHGHAKDCALAAPTKEGT